MTDYNSMNKELRALVSGVAHPVANYANAVALLQQHMDRINWAGFYFLENGILVLGPFQGKPACIEIPVGRGVCGTAVKEERTVLVGNVHEFAGHIACDSASNSEIVIPIRKGKDIIGVLDIDSPILERFTEEDKEGLLQVVEVLEHIL